MNFVIVFLIILVIVLLVAGVLFLFNFLENLQTQFTALHQIQDLYYKDLVDKLRLLRFAEIVRLRDYCTRNEMYEKAKEFNDILNKDFGDILPKM